MGLREPLKNSGSHIDASHSRQPLVKGERLVRYEVNAVMLFKHCNRLVLRSSVLQSCFPGAAQCFAQASRLDSSCCKLGNESAGQAEHITADNPWQRDREMVRKESRERKEHSLLPRRVCCSQRCAMPVQHARVPEQAQGSSSPEKN